MSMPPLSKNSTFALIVELGCQNAIQLARISILLSMIIQLPHRIPKGQYKGKIGFVEVVGVLGLEGVCLVEAFEMLLG